MRKLLVSALVSLIFVAPVAAQDVKPARPRRRKIRPPRLQMRINT